MLKWIESGGGPLVLMDENSVKGWSGVLDSRAYADNKLEDAADFMDAEQADYGKACLVEDMLGLVDVDDNQALVLNDDALPTTVLPPIDSVTVIARAVSGESFAKVEAYLKQLPLASITDWQEFGIFRVVDEYLVLFDAAAYAIILREPDYLAINMPVGSYFVSTAMYEPDEQTQVLLHKLEKVG
ncbi:Imm21 family immunity protein [Paraflavitalea pollutisoli]|uniref:Imm21 family immunity protein n=1 Tax=Paraflavitalea pollutisoli TaxID=3034143 RepID=UPI0023EE26EC|nr:Imm21 family immunity protein [Paraflavitalea sp. H1-2-19X]